MFLPNTLWEPTTNYEASTHPNEAIRMSHESLEISLKSNGIAQHPTLLESIIKLKGSAAKEEVYPTMLALLLSSLPEALVNHQLLGCAELRTSLGSVMLINLLGDLAPWAKAYPLLGEFFDNLHPILIGPLHLCTNLANTLGADAKFRARAAADSSQALGTLWLSDSLLEAPNSRIFAQPWLVPKDDSTKSRQLDPTLGEFEVGFTARRERELQEQGMLPRRKGSYRCFHVIQPQYCRLVGIDPDDMITQIMQDEIAQQVERAIEAHFAALPSNMPLVEKVYLAHERAWHQFGGYKLMSFVQEHFFSAL